MSTSKPALPVIPFASRQAWLEEHHATSDGLWLKLAKKESGLKTVSFAEALDTALCYGWIDRARRRRASTTTIGYSDLPRVGRGAHGRSATVRR